MTTTNKKTVTKTAAPAAKSQAKPKSTPKPKSPTAEQKAVKASRDLIKKLSESKKRMANWAAGMKRRKDTVKKVRATIVIKKASEYTISGTFPYGIPSIDIVTRGGIRRGRHHVMFGGPGCGKSATVANIIKTAQSNGIVPLLLAPETPDLDWMEQQGVDLEHLMYSDEVDSARILNAVDEVARGTSKEGEINPEGPISELILIDSVAAMKHVEEAKKGAGGDDMALTARRLSRFFRSQNDGIVRNKPGVLWVNQIRVNDMGNKKGGNLEDYPGGNALKHYSANDIWIYRGGKTTTRNEGAYNRIFLPDNEKVGFPNIYNIRKTKFFGVPEGTKAMGVFMEGIGFQREYCLTEFIISSGIGSIDSSGKVITIPIFDSETPTIKKFGSYSSYYEYTVENYDIVYASAFKAWGQNYITKLEQRKTKLQCGKTTNDSQEI